MSTSGIQVPKFVGRGRGRGRDALASKVLVAKEDSEVQKQRERLENLLDQFADGESPMEREVQKLRVNDKNLLSVKSNGNEAAEDNKENQELRECITKPDDDKKSKEHFWIESQMLTLTAIPHASSDVLEEADVQLYNEQVFGDNENAPLPNIKPELPKTIVKRETGRFFIVPSGTGQVLLPKDIELNTRLLCIDEQDVLHLRFHDEEQPEDKKVLGTIQKLKSSMELYYSKLFNQGQTYIGREGWIPEVGEIVVVRIKRLAGRDHERCGFITTTEYHRAIVRELLKNGLTVELIDDYGIGGVGFADIYMILQKFTVLPPQVFQCELEEMGLVSKRYLIRTIVRDCPINNIWPDCLLNYVGTTWLGNVSDSGRPLVDIKIQMKSSMRLDRFITLKGHVFQNLQNALTPFVHLVENGSCKVLDSNEQGFLWVIFDDDTVLASRMRKTLDLLSEPYVDMIKCSNLTVEMICPEDDKIRRVKNMKKIYVVHLPDHFEKLFRVTIKSVNPTTQRVRVYCIDEHIDSEVTARTLLPLHCLYPDLAQIPQLVYKVHLHGLKSLQNEDPEVRKILYKNVMLKLVHEWPEHVFPPEVYIKTKGDKRINEEAPSPDTSAAYEEKTVLPGCCKLFVESKLAVALTNEEMKKLDRKMVTIAKALLEKKEQERIESLDCIEDERKLKALQRLGSQIFLGENYKFLWDGFHVEAESSVSSASSLTGVSSVKSTVKSAKRGSVSKEIVQ